MLNQPPKKNLKWMYSVFFIAGVLLISLIIILRDPKFKLEMGAIEITRHEILMLISVIGVFIAVMGGVAYPKADTNGKRKTAMGIVIVGSAIVITALLLKL